MWNYSRVASFLLAASVKVSLFSFFSRPTRKCFSFLILIISCCFPEKPKREKESNWNQDMSQNKSLIANQRRQLSEVKLGGMQKKKTRRNCSTNFQEKLVSLSRGGSQFLNELASNLCRTWIFSNVVVKWSMCDAKRLISEKHLINWPANCSWTWSKLKIVDKNTEALKSH